MSPLAGKGVSGRIEMSTAKMDQNNEPAKVVLEGEEFQRTSWAFHKPPPKIVQWVIKYSGGLIKDEKRASYILLGFVAINIIVMLILLTSNGRSGAKLEAPPGYEIIYSEIAPPRLEKL